MIPFRSSASQWRRERREDAVFAWFNKMGSAYDGIWPVEIEGDRGVMEDLRPEPALAGVS